MKELEKLVEDFLDIDRDPRDVFLHRVPEEKEDVRPKWYQLVQKLRKRLENGI